jgi:ribosomal protein S18 acetylase RimI-like enzyme
MKPTIIRIRSGGQSGVDRAALDFARCQNIEICGWCPKGGWAEDYPEAPGIKEMYPELQETPEAEPWQRTLWNMRDAQAILTIMPEGSGESKGTELGVQEGIELGKPMFTARGVEDAAEIAAWLRALAANGSAESDTVDGSATAIGVELCVGGPRASECPDGYRVTMEILEKVMELLDLTKFEIRVMTIDDYEKVYSLWMSCKNMGFNNLDDSREGIAKYLKRNPSTCFVAECGDSIVGVIFSGHDGRRGFIHHLAVAEDCRRQGIAAELLRHAEDSLKAEGINKIALFVFNRNEAGNAFWEKQGYTRREDLAYRNKALVEMVRIDT